MLGLRPQPGVWEINVDSKIEWTYDPETPIPLKATPVTITATTLGIDLDDETGGARSAQG